MEPKNKDTNEDIYKTDRLTNTENKLRVTKWERGTGINSEVGINIHTLLYINRQPTRTYCITQRYYKINNQIRSDQSLSGVRLFATP